MMRERTLFIAPGGFGVWITTFAWVTRKETVTLPL